MSDHQLSADTESLGSPGRASGINHPTRGADRNERSLTAETGSSEQPLLPSLDPGITLLEITGGRGVSVIHALVLDHLLLADEPAFWIDAHGYATTTTLARLSPSQRLLEQIHVARGFTPYQHYAAITDLPGTIATQLNPAEASPKTQHSNAGQPSLIVTPALDAQYRDEGTTLAREHAETLQARALAHLSRYAHDYDIPVLVTRTQADQFTAPIETAAHHTVRCELTQMGPRFRGDEFETTIYPVADGAYYQTTFTYWKRILTARANQLGLNLTSISASDPSDTALGGQSSASKMPTGHEDDRAVMPLRDAWQNECAYHTTGE